MTDRTPDGRFPKGQSGNPAGRPTKQREERYREILLSTVTFDVWAEIVSKAADQAKRGDAVARKWLADYLVGVPVQRNEISGPNGTALVIEWGNDGRSTD